MAKNVMLDLETMGTDADSAIVTIGAVKFGRKITDRFYERISLKTSAAAGLTVDPDTVVWWMRQQHEARVELYAPGRLSLEDALTKFAEWIGKDARVLGNGAAFDNVLLSTAYKKLGMKRPWDYKNDYCYRTVRNLNRHVPFDNFGTHHNALDDTEGQALHLIKILTAAPKGVPQKPTPDEQEA